MKIIIHIRSKPIAHFIYVYINHIFEVFPFSKGKFSQTRRMLVIPNKFPYRHKIQLLRFAHVRTMDHVFTTITFRGRVY